MKIFLLDNSSRKRDNRIIEKRKRLCNIFTLSLQSFYEEEHSISVYISYTQYNFTSYLSQKGKPIHAINSRNAMPDFSKDMNLVPNQIINFTQYLSGNPKPKVSLSILDGKSIGNITSQNISKHTYKYELINQRGITAEDCGKYLVFNAINVHGFINSTTQIIVDCK